ncbi:MAG: aldehyde dehydrogenase family protein [Proteobacteria bacterium]|nr:MAG: aldehyde dehydrogenase family protein [Pseudomonadota bacterium]
MPASGACMDVFSPIDGQKLAAVAIAGENEYEKIVLASLDTFKKWRSHPAPKRGEVVREIADALRVHKHALARLITLEMGKILPESEGEVQEAIDIADFAVGLSRQLYGKTMHSERASHRMYEQWHPLGAIGVITAFNFPCAVWAWNAMVAAVCGDTIVWKPSEYTPLTAIALHKICSAIAMKHGFGELFTLLIGDGPGIGQRMAADRRLPLISATGSCRMGRSVAETVGKRLGRALLELGGNNAVIILKDADLDLAVRSTSFGAAGTTGQRCTTTRRILIEREVAGEFLRRMTQVYKQLPIGDPLENGTLVGPLVNRPALDGFVRAIKTITEQGGEIVCGGKTISGKAGGLYVEPTIVRAKREMPIVQEETFAPILYVIEVKDLDDAIEVNNSVSQGLSSAIFTRSLKSAERFLSARGSDCGIANVNLGTSGAEIGGAFGGEKETGGGREAGSESWKQYMRRQTNTINWGEDLPLAQGIKFDTGETL